MDLEERTSQYAQTGVASGSGTTTTGIASGTATTGAGLGSSASGGAVATDRTASGAEQVVPLAEESLQVGKRTVDKGTARVRRYVVERPAEEQIRLRNETVSIERRPVSGSANVAADAFTDKVVEVKETAEEPVVSKTARVVEEVVVRKEADERTETVRDTVRRDEVEVDDPGRSKGSAPCGKGTATRTGGTGTSGTGVDIRGTGASGTGTKKP